MNHMSDFGRDGADEPWLFVWTDVWLTEAQHAWTHQHIDNVRWRHSKLYAGRIVIIQDGRQKLVFNFKQKENNTQRINRNTLLLNQTANFFLVLTEIFNSVPIVKYLYIISRLIE